MVSSLQGVLFVLACLLSLMLHGCDRPSQASVRQATTSVRHLVDSDVLQVFDITLQVPSQARIVITDQASHSTRDALRVDGNAHVTVVASLIRTPQTDGDMLQWVASISSDSTNISAPSLVPVPEGSKLSDVFECTYKQDTVLLNTPADLFRIQSRTFQITLQ